MPFGPLKEKLKTAFGDKAQLDVPMASLTNFNIGGPAEMLFTPDSAADIQALLAMVGDADVSVSVLGGGTNVLVADGGIPGITIWMGKNFEEISHQLDGETAIVTCGVSLTLSRVLEYCIENNLEGFEFASGIPGTVGGAVRGNAGTRDGAIASVVHQVTYVDGQGNLIVKMRDELDFRYRGLDIRGRFVITGTQLKLRVGSGEKVRTKRDKLVEWRKIRQPYDEPSAGCIFVNPERMSAGRMIDEAGCKGMRVGGAMVSDKHANFIVNAEKATARDVLELIDRVRKKVFEKFGVLLEAEVRIIGESK